MSGAPFVSCVLTVSCDVPPPDEVVVVVTVVVVLELVVLLAVVVVEVEVEIVVVKVVVAVVVLVVLVVVGVPHFKTAVREVSEARMMLLWMFVLPVSSQWSKGHDP